MKVTTSFTRSWITVSVLPNLIIRSDPKSFKEFLRSFKAKRSSSSISWVKSAASTIRVISSTEKIYTLTFLFTYQRLLSSSEKLLISELNIGNYTLNHSRSVIKLKLTKRDPILSSLVSYIYFLIHYTIYQKRRKFEHFPQYNI